MFRPSPNELERLKNEEFAKRRLIRLKEVREYSKRNAVKLRNLYKEQKIRVINKIAQNIQEQLNEEDQNKLNEMKEKYAYQSNVFGKGHNNAADWIDPSILKSEQEVQNMTTATSRHVAALEQLRLEKNEQKLVQSERLRAMQLSMIIEKERAAEIAALPPPDIPAYLCDSAKNNDDMTPKVKLCDKNKFSVIESYETGTYRVEREHSNCENARIAGELHQNHIDRLHVSHQIQTEEQLIKAHLRGHQAIKKQIVHKDYQELISDLEHVAKGEMAKRQRDYYKNELIGTNSAGYMGTGHNVAMMLFKEKCRERAVEAAVMESLKDITNCTNMNRTKEPQNNVEVVNKNTSEESETKLSRLYSQIRQQKENARLQDSVPTPNEKQIHSINSIELDTFTPVLHDLDKNKPIENNQIIQDAMTATKRSDNVLEMSNWQKERHHIEQDIHCIDRRLECLSEKKICYEQMSFSAGSQSLLESFPEESNSSETLSVKSQESESVMQIREFQRNALKKLKGQLSTSQISTLERQISNFSINSSTLTETSVIPNLPVTQRAPIATTSEHSNFTVNEWVKSQLFQSIDKLPNWVTKSEENYLSDLNVSFKSSILNIKSSTSAQKTDFSSSSTTINSSMSLQNLCVQPSLTDVSTMRKVSNADSFVNTVDFHEQVSRSSSSFKENNVSNINSEQENFNESIFDLGDENSIESASHFSDHFLCNSNYEVTEDLIDFRSTTSLCSSKEFKGHISNKNQDQPVEVSSSLYHEDVFSDLLIPLDKFSYSDGGSFNEQTKIEFVSESVTKIEDKIKERNPIPEFKDYLDGKSKTMISDYEQFLTNITGTIELLNTKSPSSVELNTANKCSDDTLTMSTRSVDMKKSVPSDGKNTNESDFRKSSESFKNINGTIDDTTITNGNTIMNAWNQDDYCDWEGEESDKSELKNSELICNHKENQEMEPLLMLVDKGGSQVISPMSPFELFIHNDMNSIPFQPPSFLVPKSAECSNDSNVLILLSECNSDNELSILSTNDKANLSCHSSIDKTLSYQHDIHPAKNVLSSTMRSDKKAAVISSPDVSSIYSDRSTQLKQRIMKDYFENNKAYLQAVFSEANSSKLTFKSLESIENDTPRIADSGNPSSRYTIDHSGESTARMINDDILVTPRNDSCWTEYTTRDEFSSSHNNFQPLSEYTSSADSYNLDKHCKTNEGDSLLVDLDETIKNANSVDLIVFNSNLDLLNLPNIDSTDSAHIPKDTFTSISNMKNLDSQSLSEDSNISLSLGSSIINEDVPSFKLSTGCDSSSSPLKDLESFHSSSQSQTSLVVTKNQKQKLDKCSYLSSSKSGNTGSEICTSELDISNQSLISFLNNESICQQKSDLSPQTELSSVKLSVKKCSVDNNKDMKDQLQKWKKERLVKINKDPPTNSKQVNITKDSSMRQKDVVNMKSRTIKLWNNLEEVKKLNQLKEAEKLKMENQARKKQYAEKLRRIKMEKRKAIEK